MSPFDKAVLGRLCRTTREVRTVVRAVRRWEGAERHERDFKKVKFTRVVNGKRKESAGLSFAFILLAVGHEKPALVILAPIGAALLFVAGFAFVVANLIGG